MCHGQSRHQPLGAALSKDRQALLTRLYSPDPGGNTPPELT